MKTILDSLSDERARSETGKLLWISILCVLVGFLVFKYLGALAIFLGSRVFALTFHKGNKSLSKLKRWTYRTVAVLVSLLGWFEFAVALSGASK
jgi:hypothetical protein